MIRAFICKWHLEDMDGNVLGPTREEYMAVSRRRVVNPISRYVRLNEPPEVTFVSMHYPDADGDGIPDQPYVLVIVKGTSAIEQLGNLSSTWMLPAWRFSKPVSELTSNQREAILSKIDNAGIPRSHFAGVETYGQFLKRIAQYFAPGFSGFGRHIETDAGSEFG